MSAKYYVTSSGDYIGGFDGAPPPVGAIEVPKPPTTAGDKWTGTAWNQATQTPQTATIRQVRLALAAIGLTDAQIDAIFVTAATL